MDTKLYQGDLAADSRGLPFFVDGPRELLQQALIRLSVQKGSFALDEELGSELRNLRKVRRQDRKKEALILVKRALREMACLVVEEVETEDTGGGIRLTVWLKAGDNQGQVLVEL